MNSKPLHYITQLAFISLLLLLALPAMAQQETQSKGWVIEPTFHFGKLLKHTPKLLFEIEEPSSAFELAFKKQLLGEKNWHQMQGYPMLGISAMYYRMGQPELFGSAFSICPNLSVYLLRKRKWEVQFLFGFGLAYLTKEFDLANNPINNAIGSHINNTTQIRFVGNVRLNPNWSLKTGLSFTHYSNGATQLPNFGLNIPAGMLGLRYTREAWSNAPFTKAEKSLKKPDKRFGLDISLGMGFKERGGIGGPQSPVYLAHISATLATNRVNRVLLGGEYEYNQGAYLFGKHVGEFETEREARLRSMRFMLFAGNEFQYGNLSLSMQVGFYLQKVYLGVFPVYNRFVVRYYLPPIGRPAGRFYLAVQLKSHLVIAEYFSLSGGVRF